MTAPRMAEKALPHNLDAEKSVLGAILLDNQHLETVSHILQGFTDFFAPKGAISPNGVIYSEMAAMKEAGVPIDELTLTQWLGDKRKLERAGGAAYISALADGVPRVANVPHYAQIVREKAKLRWLIWNAEAVQAAALEDGAKPEEIAHNWTRDFADSAIHANGNGNGNGHRRDAYSCFEFLKTDFPRPKHIIEPILPEHGSGLLLAMPHRLKSWLTTAMTLACTVPGKALGYLDVDRALNPMLVQIEDYEGYVKERIQNLMGNPQFQACDPERLRIIGREQFQGGFTTEWMKWLEGQIEKFKTDFVVMDVLRRFFVGHGDINSPGDMSNFLERIDQIRDQTGVSVILVHHENRKEAELMAASSGSGYLPSWANTVMQLKRKTEKGDMTMVEFEADGKFLPNHGQMRVVLQLSHPAAAVRFEEISEGDDWREVMENLGDQWTVKDLAEELGVHRRSAQRRISGWIERAICKKVRGAKAGRTGGLARYRFVDANALEDVPRPTPQRRRDVN